MLGTMEQRRVSSGTPKTRIVQGVPADSVELDSSVETMTDEDIHQFHLFSDQEDAGNQTAYLHLGYLPQMITQQNRLLPLAILRILDTLEQLSPPHDSLLSILQRNFAWKMKVETTG